jgi:mediator of RNA polymerase II transcription subunit 18, fungi type
MVVGDRFFDQNISMFLHRVMRIPEADQSAQATDHAFLDKLDEVSPLDGSGGYVLHVSIEAVEGNSQEVKERAASQLLVMNETLKQAVNLTPGDRLALDTRLPAVNRQL